MMLHIMNADNVKHQARLTIRGQQAFLLNTLENNSVAIFPFIKRKKKLTEIPDGLLGRILFTTKSTDRSRSFIKRKENLSKTTPRGGTHAFPTEESSQSCPYITSIHDADEIKQYSKNRVCQPHVTPKEACEYTATAFHTDSSIEICHHTLGAPYELCTLRVKYTRKHYRRFNTKCDLTPCDNKKHIQLNIVYPSYGEIMIRDLP